ncbi:ATP-binding protein [Streptomyces sp. NPDC042319]|uniref:ATP-binding protein n=1 Tax=Streptomyces sp. NPDC042319 TaxID=3154332 RepID=UPI0033D11D1E
MPRRRAFAPEPVSVREAREFALDTLAEWDVVDRHDDIQLCLSELATNALLHGGGDHEHVCGFWVLISVADHVLRVEVRDSGLGTPGKRMPDDSSDSGRGLLLVSECADGWGVESGERSKAVWAVFKLGTALRTEGVSC